MGGSFEDTELVLIQGRAHPTLGGRLRLAHEANDKLTIKTEIVQFVLGVEAVVRAEVVTTKGTFIATGVARALRDEKLSEALVELAESRAVGRACRFAGYGFESGTEELASVDFAPTPGTRVSGEHAAPRLTKAPPGARGGRSAPPATAAQRRCIEVLSRKAHQDPHTAAMRLTGLDLEELTMPGASKVIDHLNRANGHGSHGDGGEQRG